MNTQTVDLLGVGIGPFNLSIAALASTKPDLSTLFLERKKAFAWHPGLLLNDAKMQTSYLKDLVTGIDPTNPYSFLNYLVEQQKLYPFIASGQSVISRIEFSHYLSWAANSLNNTRFNQDVQSVEFNGDVFTVETSEHSYQSKHLVVGTGMQPQVPTFCEPHISNTCFHASELGLRKPNLTGKRVAIIGGGQTGADVFQHLFDKTFGEVADINWISRRSNIEALDESCFTDQYFMPDYVDGFYHLAQTTKNSEVSRQKLTSDGITNDCLQGIYQRLYHDRYVLNNPSWWSIQPNRTLISLAHNENGYKLHLEHGLTHDNTQINADVVILCTGYRRALPSCLTKLASQIPLNSQGLPELCPDFSVKWPAANNNRIYMVNAGIHSHGIAEPQLSLATWRAAKIINHASGKNLYEINQQEAIVDWGLSTPEVLIQPTAKAAV
ncbi:MULTISPECIES: lysine N(6)-hydroxylase/L-ornithine N(5)-oxygenase family protein [unclassified Agarivorans]|uniref:lysine N(6)-hydroxylase/L-ornithine N(5)-oxygenase family protein n=1 Tax=unclassified Agarivorans TaxID=2636026 RepID=UPI0026E42791|nr:MULTISPECIES: SidA/IucD/PvdA family monooxygenase [unclassified Agarivorans]MDO6686348.1 SidA/IucD/PvdA family monooxygenase [Agarivorans sp. 3_MG-2023]MDO6713650.1 SidA/IucD/PvdA family monooxygenase [Agarivorans sp. 2_MG-2023]